MFIESIELKDYRNYRELHLESDQGTNILYGDNAQGKTNLLEAIYLCCTSKSYKNVKDRDIIRFGQDESHIRMNIQKNGISSRIDIHLKKNKTKGIAINGVPIRKASQLFGTANVICFSPEDLNLIKNGPGDRRRFIDMELCQLNNLYIHNLVQYNKILMQRNRLLKDMAFRPDYEETLDIWDSQLAKYGRELIHFRKEFIISLNSMIHKIHSRLSGDKEELVIFYEPNTEEDQIEEAIRRSRIVDLKQKITTAGPHRDDICFVINGIDIRRFGSQGQQRTAALSLKLSELELVRQLIHDDPILLLDDVLSELDSSRQNHLLNAIKGIQTFITCTGLDDFINNQFQINRVFHVSDGTITGEHKQ